jgi:hypothetical protein
VYSYVRDAELFARRMTYQHNDITWEGTPCCYCGDPATHDEHVFPVSALDKLLSVGGCEILLDVLRIVPACADCNLLAGDKVFYAFEDKCRFIKGRLLARYRKALAAPHWTPEEIAHLEGRLHTWIAATEMVREIVLEKVRY